MYIFLTGEIKNYSHGIINLGLICKKENFTNYGKCIVIPTSTLNITLNCFYFKSKYRLQRHSHRSPYRDTHTGHPAETLTQVNLQRHSHRSTCRDTHTGQPAEIVS